MKDSLIVVTLIGAKGKRVPVAVTNIQSYADEWKRLYPEKKVQCRRMDYYRAFDLAMANPDTIQVKLKGH